RTRANLPTAAKAAVAGSPRGSQAAVPRFPAGAAALTDDAPPPRAASPRRDAPHDPAVGVQELDACAAVAVHLQRQTIAPLRIGKHDAGDAVARLADEHALRRLRGGRARARDPRLTLGAVGDRV